MKITPEHLAHMREAMLPLLPKIASHKEALLADCRVKDLEKRLRWDWLHAAGLTAWLCQTVYPYANDTHIDTVLRSIVSELEAVLEAGARIPTQKRVSVRLNSTSAKSSP